MEKGVPTQAGLVKAARGISRRSALRAAALSLAGTGFGGGIGTALAQNATEGLPKKPFKFFFVCHVTLDQFFTPTRNGIQDACAAYGCQYQWTGSEKNVVSEMVNAMQTAIAENADGIAVCLVDPKAFDGRRRKQSPPAFRSSPSMLSAGRQPQQAIGLCRATALPVWL